MSSVRRRAVAWLRLARQRGPTAVARAVRLSVAAVASYVVADYAVADPRPVTAALTALLIVQVTLVGTLADTARRIASVLLGVGVAITVSAFVGFTWWSLGGLVAVAILLGQAVRLGPHLMEVPISAMLILAAGGAGVQATDRVAETLLGAAVGLLINVVVPPQPRTRSAGAAVEAFARTIAGLLDRVARALADGTPSPEQARDWLYESRAISGKTARVDRVLTEARQSRRLNPRAAGTTDPIPDLRAGLDALEHSVVALRAVFRSIADGAAGMVGEPGADADAEPDEPGRPDVRLSIAALLNDLARTVAAFGSLVRAEAEPGPYAAQLAEALAAVRESRARLTEPLLVDPHETVEQWRLHGSLLAAVERVLAELDVEDFGRRRERRRQDAAAAARRATQAAQRVRTSTRKVIAEPPAIRRPRRRG